MITIFATRWTICEGLKTSSKYWVLNWTSWDKWIEMGMYHQWAHASHVFSAKTTIEHFPKKCWFSFFPNKTIQLGLVGCFHPWLLRKGAASWWPNCFSDQEQAAARQALRQAGQAGLQLTTWWGHQGWCLHPKVCLQLVDACSVYPCHCDISYAHDRT